ncbi:exopolysaccharide biosynthesis polyprenyl glycosylphosphotransferase [Williamsia herbipolensis]|uniref:exopolysaccharide biosynthesis polyprenyl glycosylphosphotransferase n=1 Tax=Williamsia herbipolensis TaxID=1603258 RepID=UPI0005F7FEC2|nr:exopolysaccharide biosynthesis polyprenyl glycosylphosphotransferase [Williamsia herbipolensis]
MSVRNFRGVAEVASPPRRVRRVAFGRQRIDAVLVVLELVIVTILLAAATEQRWPAPEAAVFVALLGTGGLYRSRLNASALEVLPRLAGFCVLATLAVVVVFDPTTPILRAGVEALGVASVLFVVRVLYYAVVRARRRSRPAMRSRTAIVGGGMVASKILQNLEQHPEFGLEPIIVVDSDPLPEIVEWGTPVTDGVENLREIVMRHNVETVIVAFSRTTDQNYVSPLRQCDDLDCEIFIVPRLFEFVHLTNDMDRVHTIPLVHVRRSAQRAWCWHAKRLVDLVVSSLALLLVSPVLLVCALAIAVTDRSGPIIFKQQRTGRNGTLFHLYKFRSMRPVSAATSDIDWSPDRSLRLTAIGRFLRKTSIDELPQLWNVVRGDMSLVGPRPERPHFVEQFESTVPSYQHRHRVNVGLTGWAAINGLRGDTSIDDRAIYDNFYIENWSIWLDAKIILLTFKAMLRGTGS